ncbi:MAG: hypothetical protein LC800_21830, partial [Acidobacteria bacterium]|nr:hypothetical protein [Acidobacteriota bacterium]
MPPALHTRVASLFVAHALALAPLLSAQDSRPRRVPSQTEPRGAEPATRTAAPRDEAPRDKAPTILPADVQLARLEA